MKRTRIWSVVIGSVWLWVSLVPLLARPPFFQAPDALSFGGTDAYVAFGQASTLGLQSFTLEAWIRRTGFGQTAYTGTGGIDAIPLITKGRGEADGGRVDMNYFLGLDGSRGVLVADLEDKITGTNHPIFGVTPLRFHTWYHIAVTYNGSQWRLYLNGVLEANVNVNLAARNDSLQPAALASALDSTGAPEGFFAGTMDEVRIWSYARTPLQIAEGMRTQITSTSVNRASGLVARWGLNEGSGNQLSNSAGTALVGTIRGTNWYWGEGVRFTLNRAPLSPVLLSPGQAANNVATTADLRVTVSDPDGDNLIVTAYGRVAGKRGADFSLIALPDTQYYCASVNGGSPDLFVAQTRWIVQQRSALNIAYVAHLGDVVDNGDSLTEWGHANTALRLLEDPVTTGLSDGIPYGVAVGNHDQVPQGVPNSISSMIYNQYFGTPRFRARNYHGGRHAGNQDNQYQFFSAAGMDFLVLYFEYDEKPNARVLAWADSVLKEHPQRRAIVVAHSLLELDGTFTAQGQAVYDALKNNPNLFLLLCGHNHGESRRQDVYDGRTVHTLLADFQNLANGGDGWLRWLEFSPAQNRIRVRTYSPTLDLFDRTSSSQFDLSYNMENSGFARLGSGANFAAGSEARFRWTGLRPFTEYEWYVTVSDGLRTVIGPRWRFSTSAS